MTRIITFCGAQSTGKTTMRVELVRYLQDKGCTVMDKYSGVEESIARDAKRLGFIINEETDFETQYYIANKFMVADLETRKIAKIKNIDFIVLDRCVLDVIPYSNVSNNITSSEKDIIMNMLYKHYKIYPTKLFYCEQLSIIEKDKDRSIDKNFQNNIIDEFKNVLLNISQYQKYGVLPDESVTGRLSRVIQRIKV